MADAVGKNNEVSCGVQKLPGSKQFAGKNGREELMAGASGAVKNQNGVGDAALSVARGLAQRRVVQAQFRERLTRTKFEILDDEIAFGRGGPRSCLAPRWQAQQKMGRCCQHK